MMGADVINLIWKIFKSNKNLKDQISTILSQMRYNLVMAETTLTIVQQTLSNAYKVANEPSQAETVLPNPNIGPFITREICPKPKNNFPKMV